MRALRLCLSVLAGALAIAFAGPTTGPAQAQGGVYLFKICNNSGVRAGFSFVSLVAPNDQRFHVHGWYIVNPGGCTDIGNFPHGWIYFYGEQADSGGRMYWGGNVTSKCVTYPGPYDRPSTAGYTCDARELKGFDGVVVPPNIGTYTLTIN